MISYEPDATIFFDEILGLWLDYSKVRLKNSSYAKYVNLINNHINPLLGKYPVSSINNRVLNIYAVEKLKNGKSNAKGGLSVKTVKDIFSVIKAALKFAKNESLIEGFDIDLNLPRDMPKDMRVFSRDEQSVLEKYLISDEMDTCKLGVLLCLYTGLRIGEICALKWTDITISERTLTVRRTMQRVQTFDGEHPKTAVYVTAPKSGRSRRTIPLPDCVMSKLARLRPIDSNAYFLTGETERYIEPRNYQNRFKSYVADCKLKEANFHSTRHTFATRCVEVGFEIKSLSEILGHANVNITLDRYVHPSFDLKRSNMNKLKFS